MAGYGVACLVGGIANLSVNLVVLNKATGYLPDRKLSLKLLFCTGCGLLAGAAARTGMGGVLFPAISCAGAYLSMLYLTGAALTPKTARF